jgi:hypothetical protein
MNASRDRKGMMLFAGVLLAIAAIRSANAGAWKVSNPLERRGRRRL